MQPPLSLHGEGVIPIRNEQRRICALIWLRGIKLCPGSEPHPGELSLLSQSRSGLILLPGALQSAYGACEELAARCNTFVSASIQSNFAVSVAVAWEKLKGNSDADSQKRGISSADEQFVFPAASTAAPSVITGSSSSLASPLDSVVASQIDFIKHTLRSHTAHVFIHSKNRLTDFLYL
jgi:hypothetical protein